jgi:hypothetical protein
MEAICSPETSVSELHGVATQKRHHSIVTQFLEPCCRIRSTDFKGSHIILDDVIGSKCRTKREGSNCVHTSFEQSRSLTNLHTWRFSGSKSWPDLNKRATNGLFQYEVKNGFAEGGFCASCAVAHKMNA